MNAYEQIELDLVTEIEELETEIKERTEFIKENATREFPLTNYSRITYAMERKLDNLKYSLDHLKRSLEYLQADVKGGTKEQQAEEQIQAEKEEQVIKEQKNKLTLKLEHYSLEDGTEISVQKGNGSKGGYTLLVVKKEDRETIRCRIECILSADEILEEVKKLQATNK